MITAKISLGICFAHQYSNQSQFDFQSMISIWVDASQVPNVLERFRLGVVVRIHSFAPDFNLFSFLISDWNCSTPEAPSKVFWFSVTIFLLVDYSWKHFKIRSQKNWPKMWKCGNVPLRFYVKSIFGILEVQKLPILHYQRLWIIHFCKF